MYLTVTAINAAAIVMNKYMNTYMYHQNALKKKTQKTILFTDSEDERNAFIEFDRLLTVDCWPDMPDLPPPREFGRHTLSSRSITAALNARCLHSVSGGLSV